MRFQIADNITKFMRGKSGVEGDGEVVQPEFGFPAARANMDMRRFTALVGVEIRAVRSPAQDSRHVSGFQSSRAA